MASGIWNARRRLRVFFGRHQMPLPSLFGPHADQVATALASHDAEPFHPHEVGPRVRPHIVDDPIRPWHMTAVRNLEVLHLVEGVELGEVKRDGPIPNRAPDRQHLVRHHRDVFHLVARGLHGEGGQSVDRHHAPCVERLEAAHVHPVVGLRAF
jgi:hypothetical protein